MADLDILNSLRSRLVEERRRLAKLGVEYSQSGDAFESASKLKSIQDVIEAVDRAIADENSMQILEPNFVPITY